MRSFRLLLLQFGLAAMLIVAVGGDRSHAAVRLQPDFVSIGPRRPAAGAGATKFRSVEIPCYKSLCVPAPLRENRNHAEAQGRRGFSGLLVGNGVGRVAIECSRDQTMFAGL